MRLAGFAAVTLAALLAGTANAQPPADDSHLTIMPARPASGGTKMPAQVSAATVVPSDVTAVASTSTTYEIGNATLTNTLVTNGPVADTPENRARYGPPNSRAGKRTAAKGN
jgi:hypothetical protein